MTPIYKTDQMITCEVGLHGQEDFFCSFIYASNDVEERNVLWEDLCHHQDSLLFHNKAWLIMGDFNEIVEVEESSGFSNLSRTSSGMRDFQRMVLHCRFGDMGFQGPNFTWCKREEGVICRKRDRVLMNDTALQRFSNAYAVFEP